MAASQHPRRLTRFLRGGLGFMVNLLIIVFFGTSGVVLAGYLFGPSMLAGTFARNIESQVSADLRGAISMRDLELGWGPSQIVHGLRLLDESGNLVLEGDVTFPSPWVDSRVPWSIALIAGRLVIGVDGSLNLLRALEDKSRPGEGLSSRVEIPEELDLNLRILPGGRGLDLVDLRKQDASLHMGTGLLELSLDQALRESSIGSLSVNCTISDDSQAGEVELSLIRASVDAGLVGNLQVKTVPGHWIDDWLETSWKFADWVEDVFSLSMTLEATGVQTSTVSLQVTEPEGTRLTAAGTLDAEGFRLRTLPGACRISARADLLIGGLGDLLEPEVVIAKTSLLEGRLSDGGFLVDADTLETRLFFSLTPDSFPRATLGELALPADVSTLWVDFQGQDRRAAVLGLIGGDGGRFDLDIRETPGNPAQADLTLRQVSPAVLEKWWGLPPMLIKTLGAGIDVHLSRAQAGDPLQIQLTGSAGRGFEVVLDQQGLQSLEGIPLELSCSLEPAFFMAWIQPMIPWLELLTPDQIGTLPVRVESFRLPRDGKLEDLELLLSLDFSEVPLRLVGALDRLLATGQERAISPGLADPIRVRIAGGVLSYEGFTLPMGSHDVDAEGTLNLMARECRVALEMPLDILHQSILGMAREFPRAGLSSMTIPIEFNGSVGAERLQVDVSTLMQVRELLDPLLSGDG